VKLMILDPGHFHAALVQREMYPEVSKNVAVYAPLGPDVLDYLNRVSLFNSRKDNPTAWELDLHTGPDFLERMLRERPGNVVMMTGHNRPKIDRIAAESAWLVQPEETGAAECIDRVVRLPTVNVAVGQLLSQ